MHHDGRVQRSLVEVVSVDLLDESQQVALAVREPTEVPEEKSKRLKKRKVFEKRRAHRGHTDTRHSQLWPGRVLQVDHSALQALVAVLQADHALHVRGRRLLCRQADGDWSLRELLAALSWEVAHDFSLRSSLQT